MKIRRNQLQGRQLTWIIAAITFLSINLFSIGNWSDGGLSSDINSPVANSAVAGWPLRCCCFTNVSRVEANGSEWSFGAGKFEVYYGASIVSINWIALLSNLCLAFILAGYFSKILSTVLKRLALVSVTKLYLSLTLFFALHIYIQWLPLIKSQLQNSEDGFSWVLQHIVYSECKDATYLVVTSLAFLPFTISQPDPAKMTESTDR